MQAAKKLRAASRMAQSKLDASITTSRNLDMSLRNVLFLLLQNSWGFTLFLALLFYCTTVLVCAFMALGIELEDTSLDAALEVPPALWLRVHPSHLHTFQRHGTSSLCDPRTSRHAHDLIGRLARHAGDFPLTVACMPRRPD